MKPHLPLGTKIGRNQGGEEGPHGAADVGGEAGLNTTLG